MESLPDVNVLLEAAIAAHAAGLCIIPSKSDGTKAPFGNWKHYQSQRPDEEQLIGWFSGKYSGMGVVCGAVSGRLECVEIEGAFRFRYPEVRERLDQAGLLEEWDRWLTGYAEQSPSGGIHVLVRVSGDGDLHGNTKLALGPDGTCWIETRGEGGFVIVAPSSGPVHPSGKPWQLKAGSFGDIAVASPELFEAILDLLGTFDESPASVAAPAQIPVRAQEPGEGWIGQALAAYPNLTEVLQRHGWTYVREEPLGQLWRRPGKTIGHSGRINDSGRLINFSSSTPLPLGRRTFDAVDVDLAYELRHVPSLEERTARLREYRPAHDPGSFTTAEQSGVEPAGLNLPDDFWLKRDYLTHVAKAAFASRVCPDALWMAIKTMYAATVPFNYRLPEDGTLDYIGVMCGPSGSGKSLAFKAALSLLPPEFHEIIGVRLGMAPGSGEGMINAFIERDSKGKQTGLRYRGLGFYVDEGTWLFETGSRVGSTVMGTLRQAWSGNLTGTSNATVERHRDIPPMAVRFAMLIGIQPEPAAKFMSGDLTAGGTPQRICWSWTQHPLWPEERPEHPGQLYLPLYERRENVPITYLTYQPELQALSDSVRRSAQTGVGSEQLEAHSVLSRLKSAGLHALIEGRTLVTMDDWQLACDEWDASERVRSQVLASARLDSKGRNRSKGFAEDEVEEAKYDAALKRGIRALVGLLQRNDEPQTSRQISSALSSFKSRSGISYQEIISAAILRDLVAQLPDGRYERGLALHPQA